MLLYVNLERPCGSAAHVCQQHHFHLLKSCYGSLCLGAKCRYKAGAPRTENPFIGCTAVEIEGVPKWRKKNNNYKTPKSKSSRGSATVGCPKTYWQPWEQGQKKCKTLTLPLPQWEPPGALPGPSGRSFIHPPGREEGTEGPLLTQLPPDHRPSGSSWSSVGGRPKGASELDPDEPPLLQLVPLEPS